MPRRDRDRSHLLARRPELVHVARRRQRVSARRQSRVVRRYERVVATRRDQLAAGRTLRGAVGDHRDFAHPGFDRRLRMHHRAFEHRAAAVRRVLIPRRDPQVFAQRHHRRAALTGRGKYAVDVLQREPAIFERAADALGHQVDRRQPGCDVAEIGFGDADDRDRSALRRSTHRHVWTSGSNTGYGASSALSGT